MADSNRSRATRARLAQWRREHLARYRELRALERKGPSRKAGEIRSAIEREARALREHLRAYREDPRAYNDAQRIGAEDRRAMWGLWSLDAGKAEAERRGGSAEDYERVARQLAHASREPAGPDVRWSLHDDGIVRREQGPQRPHKARNRSKAAVPPAPPLPDPTRAPVADIESNPAAWLRALQPWRGWEVPSRGWPKPGQYQPGPILLALLQSAGRRQRDVRHFVQRVQRTIKTLKRRN